MEAIILQILLTAMNLFCAVWMYRKKRHKVAMFNCFAAGVGFMELLHIL